jgi:SAM-dependent methyltransferase
MLSALRVAEDRHFWHRTRNEFISEQIAALRVVPPSRILDLGCGGGCVAAHLCEQGYDVVGVDGQRSLVELAASRASRGTFYLHDLSKGVGEIPERDFDVVGLFDVIEHLDDPLHALNEAASKARRGGFVVGTVPALMMLWSEVDALAGHKTRYERASLVELLECVKECSVRQVVAFNRCLIPLMWVQRRAMGKKADRASMSESNLSVPVGPVNWALTRLLRIERRLGARLERAPIEGASLWFALEKR